MKAQAFVTSILAGCCITLFSDQALSDPEIDFANEAVAKKILLNKTWTCNFSGDWFPSDTSWRYEEINGSNLRGQSLVLWCSSEWGVIEGTLNNNSLEFFAKLPEPCPKISGRLEYNRETATQRLEQKKNENDVKAQGVYKIISHDGISTGTLMCH